MELRYSTDLERLTALEMQIKYERDMANREIAALSLRIFHLEHMMSAKPARTPDPSSSAFLKVGIGIALPLLVLLGTGSVETSVRVARMLMTGQ